MKVLSFTFVLIGLVITCNTVQGATSWLNYLFGGYPTISEDKETKEVTVQTTNEEPNVSGEEASKPTNVLTKPMSSLRSKVFDRVPSSSSKTYVPVYRNSSATTTPVRHQFDDYLMRKVTEAIDRLGRMSRLLVLGDAMFYKMSKTKERWNSWESSYAAINLGAPGDRTENILKRFEDGQHLKNITTHEPKVLIQIGASNALLRDAPASILSGIVEVLALFRQHLHKPKFLLCTLLPRAFPGRPVNETIKELNQMLIAQYGVKRDRETDKDVTLLDVSRMYLKKGSHGVYRDADAVNLEYFNADKINLNNAGLDMLTGFVEGSFDLPTLTNVPMHGSSSGQETGKKNITKIMVDPTKKVSLQSAYAQALNGELLASKTRQRASTTKVPKGVTATTAASSSSSAREHSTAADESSPIPSAGTGAGGSASSSSSSSSTGEKENRAGGVGTTTSTSKSSRSSPSSTGKTSLRTPSAGGAGGSGAGDSSPPLPTGWVSKVDPATKKTFFVETATGARQWDRPTGGSSDAGFKSVAAAAAAAGSSNNNGINVRDKEPRGGEKLEKRESRASVGGRDRDRESKDDPVARKTITSSLSSKGVSGPSKSGGGAHGSSGAFRMSEKKGSLGGAKSKPHPSKTRGDEGTGDSSGDE